jgi:hypothetical protein
MFSRSSHPYTFVLANFAVEAGTFFAMHFKHKRYGGLGPRPRPSQLCPWLFPPIAVPGHASYPSGHQTQSMLLSLLLSNVMPAAAAGPTTNSVTGALGPSLLRKLAERIGRNREVLGLHYPTDSAAGRSLARQIYQLLAPASAMNTAVDAASTAVFNAQALVNALNAGTLGTSALLALAIAAVDAALAMADANPTQPAAQTAATDANQTAKDIAANNIANAKTDAGNALANATTTKNNPGSAAVPAQPTPVDAMIALAQGEWS